MSEQEACTEIQFVLGLGFLDGLPAVKKVHFVRESDGP